jgi:hypothetical protein
MAPGENRFARFEQVAHQKKNEGCLISIIGWPYGTEFSTTESYNVSRAFPNPLATLELAGRFYVCQIPQAY